MTKKSTEKKGKKGKKSVGRPRIEFDLDEINRLGKLHVTTEEMANFLGCSHDTIEKRIREDEAFYVAYKGGQAERKVGLRRSQWKLADKGNCTMQIWLGKQYLGQSDQQKIEHSGPKEGLVLPQILSEEGHAAMIKALRDAGDLPGSHGDD